MGGRAWWAAVHGVAKSDMAEQLHFTFHFHALEKEMATHSSQLLKLVQFQPPGPHRNLLLFLGYHPVDVPTENIFFDLIFSRLGLSAQLPASQSLKPRCTAFCYLRSSVLPHSGLPLGPWLICWLLPITCPVGAEQGVPAIAPVLTSTRHIQATLFLIGNF